MDLPPAAIRELRLAAPSLLLVSARVRAAVVPSRSAAPVLLLVAMVRAPRERTRFRLALLPWPVNSIQWLSARMQLPITPQAAARLPPSAGIRLRQAQTQQQLAAPMPPEMVRRRP